jgi:3-phosphoshikimate 1-carboxyvinyltransferase
VKTLRLPQPVPVRARIDPPGDKSISHRAFILAAIARGRTLIVNANLGEDLAATIRALRQLGVSVRRTTNGFAVIGREDLRDPTGAIDCGNSGTTMRLLAGALAGRVDAVLEGDASLRRRPMARVADPLRAMGPAVTTARTGGPPITLRRRPGALTPLRYRLPVASAQVKSALLLAALRASGSSVITSPAQTRDHTERMLLAMGAQLRMRGAAVRIAPSALNALGRMRIPGDLSAAIYLLCAAAVLPGSYLRLRDVGLNPTRTAALDILRRMGVCLTIGKQRTWSGEPVADISVKGGAPLRAVSIPVRVIPLLVDEIPALCAIACTGHGTLSVRGARELRFKESDRIRTTVELLRAFGADARAMADGIVVRGGVPLLAPRRVNTHGDHRIGLAAAILAAATRSSLNIDDSACIATSFPGFAATWREAFGG